MALRLPLSSIAVLLLIFACIGLVPEATANSFYFNPSQNEVDACTHPVYCIEVWVDSLYDIQGFSVEITYSSDLHLQDVLEGGIFTGNDSFLNPLLKDGPVEDTLAVDGACLGCSVPGPGHLFSICFGQPWTCGLTSDLVFLWCLTSDSLNIETHLPGIDGAITVSCATSSGVATWSSVKSLYR